MGAKEGAGECTGAAFPFGTGDMNDVEAVYIIVLTAFM